MSSIVPGGLGLNSWSQTIQQPQSSVSNFQSVYNNGFTRMGFKVQSSLPVSSGRVNFQSREFSNYATDSVLQYLGQMGLLALPDSLVGANQDGIPTWSELTNWGANPMGSPPGMAYNPIQDPRLAPSPFGQPYPMPGPSPYGQAAPIPYPMQAPSPYGQPLFMSPMPYPAMPVGLM